MKLHPRTVLLVVVLLQVCFAVAQQHSNTTIRSFLSSSDLNAFITEAGPYLAQHIESYEFAPVNLVRMYR